LRQLTEGNAVFARERSSAARRTVRRDRDDVETTVDEVAKI